MIPIGNQAPQTADSGDNGSPQQIARGMPDPQQTNAPIANQTTQETPAVAEAHLGRYTRIYSTP